eukprot:4014027-Pleurochrysis_carterae.AAC.3
MYLAVFYHPKGTHSRRQLQLLQKGSAGEAARQHGQCWSANAPARCAGRARSRVRPCTSHDVDGVVVKKAPTVSHYLIRTAYLARALERRGGKEARQQGVGGKREEGGAEGAAHARTRARADSYQGAEKWREQKTGKQG